MDFVKRLHGRSMSTKRRQKKLAQCKGEDVRHPWKVEMYECKLALCKKEKVRRMGWEVPSQAGTLAKEEKDSRRGSVDVHRAYYILSGVSFQRDVVKVLER